MRASSLLLSGTFPEGSYFLCLFLEPDDMIVTKFRKQPKIKIKYNPYFKIHLDSSTPLEGTSLLRGQQQKQQQGGPPCHGGGVSSPHRQTDPSHQPVGWNDATPGEGWGQACGRGAQIRGSIFLASCFCLQLERKDASGKYLRDQPQWMGPSLARCYF